MQVEAILVLLLVLTPGLVADGVYRFLLWRPDPDDSTRIARALVLSALGLLILLYLAELFPRFVDHPAYLSSAWWRDSWQPDFEVAKTIAVGWGLHTIVSTLIGGLAVFLMKRELVDKGVRLIAGQSLHRNAWDEFAAAHHKSWVFLKLTDGRHYYGNLGVVSGDHAKDLVLWKPYPYRESDHAFELTGARALFVPADQVSSVIVAEPPEELNKLKPLLGVYKLETGERIDERQREEQSPGSGHNEKQQHALGAEGQPDEQAAREPHATTGKHRRVGKRKGR